MLDHILRIALPAIVLAGAALAADITGTWDFQVKTPQRNGTPVFVFKQEGEKLTGTYSGQLGKTNLSGTVKGDQVEFSFGSPRLGMAHYKGTVESPTHMSGDVQYGDQIKGTFTGTKK